MADQEISTTTVLGKTYIGLPSMGTLACSLWLYERRGEPDKAQALFAAHSRIREVFGGGPIDLAEQFTDLPLEGGFLLRPAVRS